MTVKNTRNDSKYSVEAVISFTSKSLCSVLGSPHKAVGVLHETGANNGGQFFPHRRQGPQPWMPTM
ncbi:mCG1025660 [Mus musculus]|nr:mCG1025660 [Mus musculus]